MAEPAVGDTLWGPIISGNFTQLDGISAVGGMAVKITEHPSTTLNVAVSAGFFVNNSGVITSYAGTSSQALTSVSSNYIWLDNTGTLTLSTSAFPSPPTVFVPIAIVVAGASTITTITDRRNPLVVIGGSYLPLSGGTMTDASVVSVGITTGLQIGSGLTQKLSFDAGLTMLDGVTCAVGTTLGFKLGTASNQRLSVYGVTCVPQAANTTDLRTAMVNFGIISSGGATPLNLNGGALTAASVATSVLTMADGSVMSVGLTSGMQFGTATSQRLAFYGAPPIVQSTMNSATAASVYGTSEQQMLQTVWSMLRNLGLGS